MKNPMENNTLPFKQYKHTDFKIKSKKFLRQEMVGEMTAFHYAVEKDLPNDHDKHLHNNLSPKEIKVLTNLPLNQQFTIHHGLRIAILGKDKQ